MAAVIRPICRACLSAKPCICIVLRNEERWVEQEEAGERYFVLHCEEAERGKEDILFCIKKRQGAVSYTYLRAHET